MPTVRSRGAATTVMQLTNVRHVTGGSNGPKTEGLPREKAPRNVQSQYKRAPCTFRSEIVTNVATLFCRRKGLRMKKNSRRAAPMPCVRKTERKGGGMRTKPKLFRLQNGLAHYFVDLPASRRVNSLSFRAREGRRPAGQSGGKSGSNVPRETEERGEREGEERERVSSSSSFPRLVKSFFRLEFVSDLPVVPGEKRRLGKLADCVHFWRWRSLVRVPQTHRQYIFCPHAAARKAFQIRARYALSKLALSILTWLLHRMRPRYVPLPHGFN